MKEYRLKNKEAIRLQRSIKYKTDPATKKRRDEAAAAYQRTPIGNVKSRLLSSKSDAKKHGYRQCLASPEGILDAFKGICDICEKPKTMGEVVIDHCHTSGIFRGWICPSCNKGLGYFYDNVKTLANAIKYLS